MPVNYVHISDEQTVALAGMIRALRKVPDSERIDTIAHLCRIYCDDDTRERFFADSLNQLQSGGKGGK